jgi:hypothetical protein
MRRRLPKPTACSSLCPFVFSTHSGRAMSEGVSLRPAFAASQHAKAYFRPHDGTKASHRMVSTRRSICSAFASFCNPLATPNVIANFWQRRTCGRHSPAKAGFRHHHNNIFHTTPPHTAHGEQTTQQASSHGCKAARYVAQ